MSFIPCFIWRAMNILAEMRSTFGLYNCKLLCINSAQGADDGLRDNPWIHNVSWLCWFQKLSLLGYKNHLLWLLLCLLNLCFCSEQKSHASHTQEIGGCLSINDLNGVSVEFHFSTLSSILDSYDLEKFHPIYEDKSFTIQ